MKPILSKKMLLCGSVAMLTLFGLYGCANQKGTDSGSTNVGETNLGDTNAANKNADNTNTGNTSVTDGQSGNTNQKLEKEVQNEYTIDNVSGLKRFELDHEVGSITMGVSDDEKIHIKAKSYVTAYTQENLDKIIDNIDIVNKAVDNTCIVEVVNKSGRIEFWDWLEKEVKQYNVCIDLEILIPHNFTSYDLSVDTGSIYVAGLEGNMDLDTDNGEIELILNENLSKSSSVELETDNGNIQINLNKNPVQYTQNGSNHVKAIVNNVCMMEATAENNTINIIQ